MTHRYLPWVRRGLSASVNTPDDLGRPANPGPVLAERAAFDIGVFINGSAVNTALQMYGPGDVTGLDTRGIVRSDPERYVSDFEPTNMASVEFDQPDFPWMFTPASADAQGRLRPWLVLVVVEDKAGVTLGVQPDATLPVLEIKGPASARLELPNLLDSWAWAHAQVITENNDITDITDEVVNGHDLNVSRLICPRRLKANRRYFACIVPAFEAGRRAGLGETPPSGLGLTPAWVSDSDDGDGDISVRLPVYYHWEFGTSNGGSEFEELVDRIEPQELAADAGTAPMYVGEPGSGITPLTGDAAIMGLEGALRPITPTPSLPTIDDVPDGLKTELTERLNAAAEHLEGQNSASESSQGGSPVGPPIYGAYHAAVHKVGVAESPQWLDELNLDPRLRTVAAIGASIVKDKQEELMDEAWAQVGDVIAANNLLNQAALSKAVAASAYDRHLQSLSPDRLFSITAPAHARVKANNRDTVRRSHDRSRLPNATTDPAFRRATSPQNRVLKRAARRSTGLTQSTRSGSTEKGAGGSSPAIGSIMAGLDDGSLTLDDLETVPDGIGGTEVLGALNPAGNEVDMSPIGGAGAVPSNLVQIAQLEYGNLSPGGEPDPPLVPRTGLEQGGLITTQHIAGAAEALGTNKGFLLTRIGEALGNLRPDGDSTGLQFVVGPDGQVIPELVGGSGDGGDRPPLGGGGGRRETDGGRDPGGGTGGGTGDGPPSGPTWELPATDDVSIREFGRALEEFTAAFEPDLDKPNRPNLGLAGQRDTLLAANDPRVVAVRRTESRIERSQWPQQEPLDPIMVAPEFPTALYGLLTEKSREYFLPGIGEIAPNSVTLAETNSRFVEALMVGVNHEMNHELHWRQYPTDRRGTPFRRFWSATGANPDIQPIHQWAQNGAIGTNLLGSSTGSVVLLIRADLLAHYPNTIIYASPSNPDGTLDTSVRKDPTMIGRLEPDLTFVMLPMTRADLLAGDGYYVVFQEQSTELQFGLDGSNVAQPPVGSLTTWNDLSWAHGGVQPGGHLAVSGSPVENQNPIDGVDFGQNSAHMAAIVLQRPVMVAFHADDMIGA